MPMPEPNPGPSADDHDLPRDLDVVERRSQACEHAACCNLSTSQSKRPNYVELSQQ